MYRATAPKLKLIFVLFFILKLFYLSAQDQALDLSPTLPSLYILKPDLPPQSKVDSSFSKGLYESLFDAFENSQVFIMAKEQAQSRFALRSQISSPVKEFATVQLWLEDNESGRVIASTWRSMVLDLSFTIQANELAHELLELYTKLDTNILAATGKDARSLLKSLTIIAELEGMDVRLADGRVLGIVKEGKIVLEGMTFERDKALTLDCSKLGYINKRIVVTPDASGTVQIGGLRFKSSEQWLLNYHLNYLTAAGVSWRPFLNHDWTWFETGIDIAVFSTPIYDPALGSNRDALIFYPGLNVGAGSYLLLGPENLIRVSVATRIGWTVGISTLNNTSVSSDFYLQPLVIGLELNFSDFVIREEMSYRFYLGLGDSSLFETGQQGGAPRIDILIGLKTAEVQP